MKQILTNILGTFNNKEDGWSAKKVTAFVLVVCVVSAHVKWIAISDYEKFMSHFEMVLTIDFGFVLTLFGINEYSKKQTPKKSGETNDQNG